MTDKLKFQLQMESIEFQNRDGQAGAFSAIISRPSSLVHGFYMIASGAFAEQARRRNLNLPMIVNHEERVEKIIGRVTRIRQESNGDTVAEGYFHQLTDLSRDVYAMFKAGVATDVSLGALKQAVREPTNAERGKGAQEIVTQAELIELSAVSIGADNKAKVTTVKRRKLPQRQCRSSRRGG